MADQLTVHSTVEGSTVTIAVSGHLAAAGALDLLDAVRDALERKAIRIDVDLCNIESFTEKGVAGLARCRELGAGLSEGLHYRTDGAASQAALLAAFDVEEKP